LRPRCWLRLLDGQWYPVLEGNATFVYRADVNPAKLARNLPPTASAPPADLYPTKSAPIPLRISRTPNSGARPESKASGLALAPPYSA
jgi:hypothetical protein